jgi:hypothetical protein
MNKKPEQLNRQEKIKLLEGIASGKIPIDDLQDTSISLWIQDTHTGNFKGEGMELTEHEYRQYQEKHHRKTYLNFKPAY